MDREMMDSKRLELVRSALRQAGVDGFVLPVTDEFQGEYSAACARRVTWLTGFDGSAGCAAVTMDKAALFVDGRYTLQAAQEVDGALYEIYNSAEKTPVRWLTEIITSKGVIGYDPLLHTPLQIEQWEEALAAREIGLSALMPNPVDTVWENRPPMPQEKVSVHRLEHAGKEHGEKRLEMAAKLAGKEQDAFLVTQPDALCWLLNIRGGDIPYNPLPLCYGLLFADAHVELFIDDAKLDSAVREHLGKEVDIAPFETIEERLALLGEEKACVGLDAKWCPVRFMHVLEQAGADISLADNPITLAKALKNPTEIEGMRRAHIIDGVAVTRFLCWFDTQEGEITELQVAERLERFRAMSAEYRGASFATIAGSGAHGAIVHYRADEASNRAIAQGEILLLDSGGQYPFGTTDITRTVARGTIASAEFRDRFTRVLKGHIALAQAQFPEGTSGGQLDILARQPLWDEGLDYDHGTGHGVGCFLCVHEGPQRISKRGGDVALKPGMILSNEPGYYKTGDYGIRIENLVLVVERETVEGKRFLGFNTLTLAPIDTRLIEPKLLGDHERAWLNHYHRRVLEALTPSLDDFEREWLAERCAGI